MQQDASRRVSPHFIMMDAARSAPAGLKQQRQHTVTQQLKPSQNLPGALEDL